MKKNMMHLIRLSQSVIWFIVLSASPALAGRQSPFPASGDLVLEMSVRDEQPTDYYVPRTGVLWMEFFELKPLYNWRRPADQPSNVGAVHLDYRRLHDAVWIDVMVVFGTIDLSKALPDDETRSRSGGTYVIRVGESATLQELARFGIEPFKVKVFPVEVRTLNPAEVDNKTKAIEVVRIDQSRHIFRIALKNLSSKNIVFGTAQCAAIGAYLGPLAPGQVKDVYCDLGSVRSTPAPESYVPRAPLRSQDKPPQANPQIEHKPVPPKLAVTSIVFEDLTFEGELEPALIYIARRRGSRIQTIRIIGLLQAAIENPEQDSAKALETLRQQVLALIEAPDNEVLDEFAKRFGPFTQYQRNRVLWALKDSLKDTKEGMLERAKLYEKNEAPKGTSLQSWLRKMKTHYEEETKKP